MICTASWKCPANLTHLKNKYPCTITFNKEDHSLYSIHSFIEDKDIIIVGLHTTILNHINISRTN